MYDVSLVKERLGQIRDALLRIQNRFSAINSPEDFEFNDSNRDKLDAIAMMLIVVGESFKKIDKETGGKLLSLYPQIDWKGIKGVRDVLAHDYFDIDMEEIYKICLKDVPALLDVVQGILREIK
jgi:uncharacterized protein with HEPN domain